MANANIFQQYLQPPKSVVDYQTEYENADALRNRNALAALTLQQTTDQTQQALAERQAMRSAAQQAGGDRNAFVRLLRASGMPGLVTQADSLEQSGAKLAESNSIAAKNTADAGATNYRTSLDKANKAISDITALNTPQEAMSSLQAHLQAGDMDQAKYQTVLATLQPALTNPAAFSQWKRQMVLNIMDAKDRIAATAPKVEMVDAGGTKIPTNVNADAGAVGPVAGAAPIKVTVSPDAALTAQTSRANNAATIAAENLRAGMSPDGKPTGDMETTAQAVANGQLPPPTGMALLNPKNQRILARVMEINPNYDYTTVSAKKAAATAFTTGREGQALRSVSTANAHLDQLNDLVDAMGNGNTQVINRVGNYFATQTGDPKVTNFDAIKNIVGQEVVKAIVAGGGSAGERDEAAKTFSDASSPAQLKGAIGHYRMVMKAQADNLLAQRRAAGLPDSTLPNYNAPGAAPGAPAKVVDFGSLK